MFSTLNIITDLSSGRRPDSIELTIVGVLNADRKFTDTRFLVTVICNTLNQSETTRTSHVRSLIGCVAPGCAPLLLRCRVPVGWLLLNVAAGWYPPTPPLPVSLLLNARFVDLALLRAPQFH